MLLNWKNINIYFVLNFCWSAYNNYCIYQHQKWTCQYFNYQNIMIKMATLLSIDRVLHIFPFCYLNTVSSHFTIKLQSLREVKYVAYIHRAGEKTQLCILEHTSWSQLPQASKLTAHCASQRCHCQLLVVAGNWTW